MSTFIHSLRGQMSTPLYELGGKCPHMKFLGRGQMSEWGKCQAPVLNMVSCRAGDPGFMEREFIFTKGVRFFTKIPMKMNLFGLKEGFWICQSAGESHFGKLRIIVCMILQTISLIIKLGQLT